MFEWSRRRAEGRGREMELEVFFSGRRFWKEFGKVRDWKGRRRCGREERRFSGRQNGQKEREGEEGVRGEWSEEEKGWEER